MKTRHCFSCFSLVFASANVKISVRFSNQPFIQSMNQSTSQSIDQIKSLNGSLIRKRDEKNEDKTNRKDHVVFFNHKLHDTGDTTGVHHALDRFDLWTKKDLTKDDREIGRSHLVACRSFSDACEKEEEDLCEGLVGGRKSVNKLREMFDVSVGPRSKLFFFFFFPFFDEDLSFETGIWGEEDREKEKDK